jgi:DNA-binding LacI/PurR family transcriptional regulator
MSEAATKPLAKYLQLRDILKKDIVEGVYPQGSKLPTCRELTTMLGASYLTITNALRELEQDGYVRRLHGKGIFVKKVSPEPGRKTRKVGYFVKVKVSLFAHFFTEVLEGLNRLPIYNVPVNMPAASVSTTLAENELWMDDVFHNSFNSLVILGDRHFPFKTLMRYRNEAEQINFIFIDNSSLSFPMANRILVDFEKVGYTAATHFLNAGHKKLAVLSLSQLEEMYCRQMGVKKHDHGQQILDGIEQAYNESNVDFFSNVRVINDSNIPPDDERCREELKSCFEQGFTAFFAVGDSRAQKVYALAEDYNMTIGHDLAVLGLYNTPWCEIFKPALSSISMNETEIGRITAQAIREEWHGKTVMVEPKLIIRDSC